MAKITVYSHQTFDNYCETLHLNDDNVENENVAFISIINTPGTMKVWCNEEDMHHWFKHNHDNVINLDFDDVPKTYFYRGIWWYELSNEDAEDLVRFIEKNIGKDFVIHCYAGRSRSQAVRYYIENKYPDIYTEIVNKINTPNVGVYTKLNDTYDKLHGIDKQKEYEKLFT